MDSLDRAINDAKTLRCIAVLSTEAVREACRRQDLRGIEAIALGRAMTCASLLGTLAKQDRERVRILITGSGALGRVIVDAHGDGRLRGCLETRIDPEPADARDWDPTRRRVALHAVVGDRGHLVVTRDLGLGHPYQGTVPLSSGEIDLDLQDYLTASEQLPSALCADVLLDSEGQIFRSAGVLIQTFPGSEKSLIDHVRKRLTGDALGNVLADDPSPPKLIDLALGGEHAEVLETQGLRFHCGCGPKNTLRVLSALGIQDLLRLAGEQAETVVSCHFCATDNTVTAAELRELAGRLRKQEQEEQP